MAPVTREKNRVIPNTLPHTTTLRDAKTTPKCPALRSTALPNPPTALSALALLLGGCNVSLSGSATLPGPYDAVTPDADDVDDIGFEEPDTADTADTSDIVDSTHAGPLPDKIKFGTPSSTPITDLGCSNDQYVADLDVFARADGTQVVYGLCTTADARHTTLFNYQPDIAGSLVIVTDTVPDTTASILARPVLMAPYSNQEQRWFASAALLGNTAGATANNAGFAELLNDGASLVTPVALPWVTADGTIVSVADIDTTTTFKPSDIRGIAASADWLLVAAANTVPRCAWNPDVTDATCTEAANNGIAFAVNLSATEPQSPSNIRALPIGHLGASSVALIDVPQSDGTIRERLVVVAAGATNQYAAPDDILADGGVYVFDGSTLAPIHAHAAVVPESAGFSGIGVHEQRISTGDRRGNVYLVNTAKAPAEGNTPETAPAFAQFAVASAGATAHQISGTAFTPEGKFIVALDDTAHTLTALRTDGDQFATTPVAATSATLPLTNDTHTIHGITLYTGAQHYVLVNHGNAIVRVAVLPDVP